MNRHGPTGRFVSRFSGGYFSAPIELMKFSFSTDLGPIHIARDKISHGFYTKCEQSCDAMDRLDPSL